MLRVRALAEQIGALANAVPTFRDDERDDALIANVDALDSLLPYDALPFDMLLAWAIDWIRGNGRLLGKPTKFDVRDGRF